MPKRNYARMIGTAVRTGRQLYSLYNNVRSLRTNRRSAAPVGSGSTGNLVSRVNRRSGRSRRWGSAKLKKAIIGAGSEYIYRCQATSMTYLGPGFFNLGMNKFNPTSTTHSVPIHFMSLSNIPFGNENGVKGAYKSCLRQVYYDSVAGQYAYSPIGNQASSGAYQPTGGVWKQECSTGQVPDDLTKVFHKYTDIKLNLYGAITIPVKYTVLLCQMDENIDLLKNGPDSFYGVESDQNMMLRDMVRPLTFSSVGHNSNIKYQKNMRIIKKHTVTINPLPYSDQQGEVALPDTYSKMANIHELRWFVRHDRYRDYKWSELTSDYAPGGKNNALEQPAWDVVTDTVPLCDVEWGKRLYLFVMATAPTVGNNLELYPLQDTAHSVTQGSYDVNIRQCWRINK